MEKFSVSYSSLETYKTCPRKYFYNYILKLPRGEEKPWFVLGNFNHLILEKFFRYVIFFKTRNRSYDKKQLMYRAYESALRNYNRLYSRGLKPKLTQAQIDETRDILKGFFESNKTIPDVLFVEKEFYIDIADGIVLHGYIDRVDSAGEDAIRIVDYKTSKKSYKIDESIQLDLYAIGMKRELGDHLKIFKQLDFIKLKKSTDPNHEHEINRENQVLEQVAKQAIEIKSKIDNGDGSDSEAWEPIDNKFCWACDFRDTCLRDRGISFI